MTKYFSILILMFASVAYGSADHSHDNEPKSDQENGRTHEEEGGHVEGEEDEHGDESSSVISADAAQRAGIKTEKVGAANLRETVTLFGRIRANAEQVYALSSRYPGLVQRVFVSEGDRVTKGDVVANVEARDTLQTVPVRAPADGIVTARYVNAGSLVEGDALVEVTNIDTLWLDLDAFPKDLSKLSLGQSVVLHGSDKKEPVGTLSFIAPGADVHTRSTRVRAVLTDQGDNLRPGILVRADIIVQEKKVPLAVKQTAIQGFLDKTAVFVKEGDVYEAHFIKAGLSDGEWVEVLDGLESGAVYVSENSFLVKADILKSGASHEH